MKKLLKSVTLALVALSLTVALASCGKGGYSKGDLVGSSPSYENGSDYTGGEYYPDKDITSGGDASTVVEDRKIIKTVNESVQTDAYDGFMKSLTEKLAELGGFVSSKQEGGESYYNTSGLRYCNLTLRIPAENLDAFTLGVDSLAVVTSYSESQNDVTGSYIDIESRIAVLAAEETALLDMLSKSSTVDTSLKVRERLLSVQSDLASLRAQLASIDDRAAFSTVYLHVREVRRATENNPTFFQEVGGNFSDNLYSIGQFFRNFAVWLLGDSLVIILTLAVIAALALLARFIFVKLRKSRKGKPDPTAPNEAASPEADPTSDDPSDNT